MCQLNKLFRNEDHRLDLNVCSRVPMHADPCKVIFLRDPKKTWVRTPPRKFHENAIFSFPTFLFRDCVECGSFCVAIH